MTYDERMQKMFDQLSETLRTGGLHVKFQWTGFGVRIFLNTVYVCYVDEDGFTSLNFIRRALNALQEEVFDTDYDY